MGFTWIFLGIYGIYLDFLGDLWDSLGFSLGIYGSYLGFMG